MIEPVDRIQSLIISLPTKDIHLGNKFLKARDFESLKDLVDSAICIVKKNLNKENPKEEYLNIDLGNLNRLKSEVDLYTEQLEIIDVYEDFEEYEIEENYY